LALNDLWDALEPESEKILGNVELLPSITNPDALPYHDINGDELLIVKDVPNCLLPQKSIVEKILYNFDQFISHASQGYLTKQNLVLVTSHKAT
jgi:hypothetical protein